MKVGLFGSVHSLEALNDIGYDEKNNIQLFNKFKPDIICGEVRIEDFKGLNIEEVSCYTPSEYKRYIFDYCKKFNIDFIPCDYFKNSDIVLNRELGSVKLTEEQIKNYELVMKDFYKIAKESKIPYNSNEFNEIVRKQQQLHKLHNPKVQEIIWDNRNEIIVKNILKVIKNNPNKNILVIFGAAHIYWIKDELEKLENIEIVFPL